MKQSPLNHLFANTTVCTDTARRYLRADPGYLQAATEAHLSPYLRTIANHTDYVAFHLRHYLGGVHQTLHRVFVEIRAFMALDELIACSCIQLVLQQVKEALLANEWYELMPRFEKASKRINKTFAL